MFDLDQFLFFSDKTKINCTFLPCSPVHWVLIWFPSDNKTKIVQSLTAAEGSGMFLLWHWEILRSRMTRAGGEAVCSFGRWQRVVCLPLQLSCLEILWLHSGHFAELLGVGQRALHLAPADGNHLSTYNTTVNRGMKAEQHSGASGFSQLCSTPVWSLGVLPWNPAGKDG